MIMHRRPRPVRDFLVGLWVLALVRWSYTYLGTWQASRRVYGATPAEIRQITPRLSWTRERIPIGAEVSLSTYARDAWVIRTYPD